MLEITRNKNKISMSGKALVVLTTDQGLHGGPPVITSNLPSINSVDRSAKRKQPSLFNSKVLPAYSEQSTPSTLNPS